MQAQPQPPTSKTLSVACARGMIVALVFLMLATSRQANGQDDEAVLVSGVELEFLAASLDPADTKIVLEFVLNAVAFESIKHVHHTYEDEPALLDALSKKKVDMFVMFTSRYLEHIDLDMEPAFVLSRGGDSLDTYHFLSQPARATTGIEGFRGKPLLLYSGGGRTLVEMWLTLQLARKGLPGPDEFFESITFVSKPSKAAIPVFFGKAPACILHDDAWKALTQLNPQMGRRLTSVEKSPALLQGLLLFRKSMSPGKKKIAREGIQRMNTTPAGTQLLRFAKVEKIIPFEDKHLTGTKKLYADLAEAQSGEVRTAIPVDPVVTRSVETTSHPDDN